MSLPAPDRPVWVIGDVHGCDGLLGRLMDRITRARAQDAADLVLVGDYIDRGTDSRAVLARLRRLDATCIMGNHERMMLDFLDNTEQSGQRWLRHGGAQTLASYGVNATDVAPEQVADALRSAMGADMIDWLRQRPLMWKSGNLAVVHAGIDPALLLGDQAEQTLLWGHPAFLKTRPQNGVWIVHGHTVTGTPGLSGKGRIAVDSGAYATGYLTAALIRPDGTVTLEQT